MQMFIKKQIGKTAYTFVAEGENLHEMVKESQKLSFPDVPKCGLCGKDDLYLNARLAGDKDEYEYTEVKCRSCRAQLQFGQTKQDSNVFYLRKDNDGKCQWQRFENPNEQAPLHE